LDFGPAAMGFCITLAVVCPVIYSFFVDHYDKVTPQKKNY
jgi:hypothetical protein